MIKEDFKREIHQLFIKGFREALEPGFDAEDLQIKEQQRFETEHGEEFFLLTVSSQLFRIFILLHVSRNQHAENFVAKALNIGTNAVTEENFYDYLGEVGNAFCGSIKRNLNKTVPHLGMSTPNRLDKDCLPYLSSFKIDDEVHAIAEYQGQTLFHASAYLSADDELNYEVKSQAIDEAEPDSGELEFF
ncbi:MAG: hypothetical protein C9356_00510 [Oleiphilus sp.]|nr:MAG: hypothetical protein C9356_00510 [Oleiphilus sp.]